MADLKNLETFLIDALLRYDPTIETGEGSRARTYIIDPLVSRLGPDPVTTPIAAFIKARLEANHPGLNGRAFQDVLAGPLGTLLRPFQRELSVVRAATQVSTALEATDDELEARAASFFVDVKEGVYSGVTARVYYNQPRAVSIGTAVAFNTSSGLSFFPARPYYWTADEVELQFDSEKSLYYVDVFALAAEPGSAYNIGAEEIVSVTGLDGVYEVTNLYASDNVGEDRDTGESLVSRIQYSLSSSSPVTARGIIKYLSDQFGDAIRSIVVVGFGDSEMLRDILKAELTYDDPWFPGDVVFASPGSPSGFWASNLYNGADYTRTNRFTCTRPISGITAGDFVDIINPGPDSPDWESGSFRVERILSDGVTIEVTDIEDITSGLHGQIADLDVPGGADILGWTDRFDSVDPTFGSVQADDILVYDFGSGAEAATILEVLSATSVRVTESIDVRYKSASPTAATISAVEMTGEVEIDLESEMGADIPIVANTYLAIEGKLGVFPVISFPDTETVVVNTLDSIVSDPITAGDIGLSGAYTIFNAPNGFRFQPPEADVPFFVYRQVEDGYIPFPLTDASCIVREAVNPVVDARLTISGVVGGYPDAVVNNDEVHVGGCYDAYIYDRSLERAAASIDEVLDSYPIERDLSVTGNSGDSYVTADSSPVGELNDVLMITIGGDVKGYRITGVDGNEIYLTSALEDTFVDAPALISRELEIDPFNPVLIRREGSSAKISDQSNIVQITSAAEDPTLVGTEAGDIFEILYGQAKGEYQIDEVYSDKLVLSSSMEHFLSNVQYKIKAPLGAGVSRPLATIDSVKLLPSTNVPYRRPIALITEAFSPSRLRISGEDLWSQFTGSPASLQIVYAGSAGVFNNAGVMPGEYLVIYTGPNAGRYRIYLTFQGDPGSAIPTNRVDRAILYTQLQEEDSEMKYAIGKPASGYAYFYFKDRVDVFLDSEFEAESTTGATFEVATDLEAELSSGFGTLASVSPSGPTLTRSGYDFFGARVQEFDSVYVPYKDLKTGYFSSGEVDAVGQTLRLRVDNSKEYNILFTGTNPLDIDNPAASALGVVQQISTVLRAEPNISVFSESDGLGGEAVIIRGSIAIEIVSGSFLANVATGWSAGRSNAYSSQRWTVINVERDNFQLTGAGSSELTIPTDRSVYYRVLRSQAFHAGPYDLEEVDGLYRAKVWLESTGFGSNYDLADESQLTTEYRLNGYELATENPGLSGGVLDSTKLLVSSAFVDENGLWAVVPTNGIEISYRWSPLASTADELLNTESSRVVTANTMVKHFFLGLVYMTLPVTGTAANDIVLAAVERYIQSLDPLDALEAFDIQAVLRQAGVYDLVEPTAIGVLYLDENRQFTLLRSLNTLSLPRTVKLLPEAITVE